MKVAIEGMDGSGKTTVAKAVARNTGYKYLERPIENFFGLDSKTYDEMCIKMWDMNEPNKTLWFFGLGHLLAVSGSENQNVILDRHILSTYFWDGNDENQNVFSRDFGDKFFIDGEPFVLRYNIRNTSNIYQYTLDRTALGVDTLVNQIEGVEPDVRKLTRKQAVISFVDSVINKLVNKEGVLPDKITILSNLGLDQSVLNDVSYVGGYPLVPLSKSMQGAVTFTTVEDFKGLESDIIIFINHTYKGKAKTDTVRAIEYTALTRARFYLYVIDYERTL